MLQGEQIQHVRVCMLQGKQIQHSPHALPLRQGTRRRQGLTNQSPPQQQQQQQQFQAQQSMQQQGSISRLASDNLINCNTMNMNGAALLTGLGESLFLFVLFLGSARRVPGTSSVVAHCGVLMFQSLTTGVLSNESFNCMCHAYG